MYTIEQLTTGITDLATRTATAVVHRQAEVHEREFHQGQRAEFRRSANDVPLAALRVLEDIRQAAESAQSALLHQLEVSDNGPTYTEIGAALGLSKQSGRKRAAAATSWSQEHRPPKRHFSIEQLVQLCVGPEAALQSEMHWPDDGHIPETGPYGEPLSQEALAQRALALGIGGNVNR